MILLASASFIFILGAPFSSVRAEEKIYEPLAPFPGVSSSGTTFQEYIPAVFNILIAVAGVLAVIMITIGGIQYMSTDSVYNKDSGRKTINAAIGGLLLALISWFILNTINPSLLNTDLTIDDAPAGTGGGGGGGGGEGSDNTNTIWRLVRKGSGGLDILRYFSENECRSAESQFSGDYNLPDYRIITPCTQTIGGLLWYFEYVSKENYNNLGSRTGSHSESFGPDDGFEAACRARETVVRQITVGKDYDILSSCQIIE